MGDMELVRHPDAELLRESDLPGIWRRPPSWQSKGLVERVYRLLPVDPSSACQRIFDAAIHADFALRLAHKDMRIANLALAELSEALNRGCSERDSRSPMLLQGRCRRRDPG